MDHPALASRHVTPSHCSHLRHKGMYTGTEGAAELALYRDPIEATAYWCVCTQRSFGPDGEPVGPADCTHGRRCCEH